MNKWYVLISIVILIGCQPLYRSNKYRQDWFTAVGYANITQQEGETYEEKQIHAIRASKLDAYRELTEQIYGMRVSDIATSIVDGLIVGAEVVRNYKVGDNYVTELRLNIEKMNQLRRDYCKIKEIYHVPDRPKKAIF
ncbi:ribosomal protein S12 methylthiotransferase Rim [Candidatus Photodesmus katoptron]|uniref:Flagellar biosynthesis protein FlgP n=1 Tax=Candidatus Photodesmus katoptron Akat1 TaxID=1236703 RepID=S3EIG1_9GAMM|nr:hypothetical protein [Candidatus Photodesmus katoptron]EPE37973.1 hypothetical protein O1U_0436 [Candidatus Photodesmus katoptron Akat1]KEY90241.1 ribosomal protein S12 methylthiotransferase Rim [Candidatus Photodesmus katoptron]